MDLEHIQDEIHSAIEGVESALSSLGAMQVEYMSTREISDILWVLESTAREMEKFANRVTDRQPISPELAEALRKMEEDFRNRISARRTHPSP